MHGQARRCARHACARHLTTPLVRGQVKRSTKSGKRSSHKVTVRDPAVRPRSRTRVFGHSALLMRCLGVFVQILVYDFGLLSNIGVLLVGAAFGGIASSVAQLPASLG